jgi:hypothetical protein
MKNDTYALIVQLSAKISFGTFDPFFRTLLPTSRAKKFGLRYFCPPNLNLWTPFPGLKKRDNNNRISQFLPLTLLISDHQPDARGPQER